jgi:hypothetical protein
MRKAQPKAELTDAELEQLYQQYAGAGCSDPNEYADAPRWGWDDEDLKAQLEYVIDRWVGYWTVDFPLRSEEERAVKAALRGKPKKLAELLRQPNLQLAPSTWALVAEFISGERNLRTGRRKGEAGRPHQSEKQRRQNSKAHRAAEIFLVIQSGLSVIYHEQSKAQIHDRALLLAELQTGVSEETIKNYLEKPKLPYRVRVSGYGEEDSPNGYWVEDLLEGTNAAAPPVEHVFEGETWTEFWQSIVSNKQDAAANKRRTPAAKSKS